MFNLEQSISQWKRDMLASGIKAPAPLEELEAHLRDDVERQMRSGLEAARAFALAVQEIGLPGVLKSEFKKNERITMKRIGLILLGIFGVLFGAAFILPAVAWYRDHGAMPAEHVEFLLLGIVIVAAGLGMTAWGVKIRKA